MRIVIAEDEAITRKWISRTIEKLGQPYYICGLFSNGAQALEYCSNNAVDLLITDIVMPVMDGLTLIQKIKEKYPKIQVVLLSSYDQFSYAREAIRLGVSEFILKPEATKENLLKCLEKFKENKIRAESGELRETEDKLSSLIFKMLYREDNLTVEQIENELAVFNISLSEKNLIIILFKVEDSRNDKKYFELSKLFLEIEMMSGFAYEQDQKTQMIVSNIDNSKLIYLLDKLFELLQKHSNQNIYMGISRFSKGYSCLPDLYRQASVALEFCAFYEFSKYCLYDTLSKRMENSDIISIFSDRNSRFSSLIQDMAYDVVSNEVYSQLQTIKNEKIIPHPVVKSMVVEIIVLFIQKIRKYDLSEEEGKFITTINISETSHLKTIDDLMEWYRHITNKIIEILSTKDVQYSLTVQKIINYIQLNYAEEINLHNLSDLVHLNKSYISTVFKKETGKSMTDYITHVRLEKASEFLKYTTMSISEISDKIGFTDISYFCRCFKKINGVKPTDFREQYSK